MVVVRICDIVKAASTYEDGAQVFNVLESHLKQDETVELSFEGIPAVSSAFVNSALIPLLDNFPFSVIRSRLLFTHTTRFINDVIRRRFEFVLKHPAK